MATMQMTARRGSLQRSSTCPKPKSYSVTQVLGSHHKVSLPSHSSRLRRVCKGISHKNVQEWSEQLLELGNIATTQSHATVTVFGQGYVHNENGVITINA